MERAVLCFADMQWWTLKQLRSASAKTRLAAVQKLSHRGDLALVSPLCELLADPDPAVRGTAALALSQVRDEKAVAPLIDRLKTDPEPDVRRAIIKALVEIKTENCFPPIVEALGDPAGEVGWQAAQALKAAGWEPDNNTERAALHLANNHFDAAIALGPDAIGPLIGVARGNAFHRSIRAIEALALVGGAQAVKPILDCLASSDFTVRSAAATALGEIGDARAAEPLIRALRDAHHQVCLAACLSLAKVGDQRAVEPLIGVLEHSAPDVRTAAVETLGKLRDPRAVRPLVECLRDADNEVRENAAAALGLIGDEQAIEHLVPALTDLQSSVRQVAGAALCRINPHWERTAGAIRAIPNLQLALKSREYWVRHSAGDVLKKLGLSREEGTQLLTDSDGARKKRLVAQNVLFGMLGDGDRAFRQAAAEALGRIGLAESISRLVEILADADRGVKTAAARSLEVLRWQTDHLSRKASQLVALERWADAAALGDHAVDALVEAFSWSDPLARRRATEGLVHIGSAKAVSALRVLATSPVSEIREEAVSALGALNPTARAGLATSFSPT